MLLRNDSWSHAWLSRLWRTSLALGLSPSALTPDPREDMRADMRADVRADGVTLADEHRQDGLELGREQLGAQPVREVHARRVKEHRRAVEAVDSDHAQRRPRRRRGAGAA